MTYYKYKQIALLEARSTDFGFFFPTTFPKENLNPKFHIAVAEMHHFATLMAEFGISPGMGNEQSIEAIHVKYNRAASHNRNARNAALRLKRMMRRSHTTSNASLQSNARNPTKRKAPGLP